MEQGARQTLAVAMLRLEWAQTGRSAARAGIEAEEGIFKVQKNIPLPENLSTR